MTAGDWVVMLASALWTVAVGATSYYFGVRRGLGLADGWDWERSEAEGEDA